MREGTVRRTPCQPHLAAFLLLGFPYACHLAEGEKQPCWTVPLPGVHLREAGWAVHASCGVTLTRGAVTPAQMV